MLTAAYQQRARVPLFVPKMALYLSALGGGIWGRGLRAGTHGLGKRRGDWASSLVLSALSRHIRFRFFSRGGLEPIVRGRGADGAIVVKRQVVQLSVPPWNSRLHGALQPWHSAAVQRDTRGSGPCDGRTGDERTVIPALFLILLRGFGVVRTFWASDV